MIFITARPIHLTVTSLNGSDVSPIQHIAFWDQHTDILLNLQMEYISRRQTFLAPTWSFNNSLFILQASFSTAWDDLSLETYVMWITRTVICGSVTNSSTSNCTSALMPLRKLLTRSQKQRYRMGQNIHFAEDHSVTLASRAANGGKRPPSNSSNRN